MINPFEGIQGKNKEKLLKALDAETVNVNKNTNIEYLVRGDNTLAIVTRGYIEITKESEDGSRTIIDTLEENDIVSSSTLYVKDSLYNIITKEETTLIIIDLNLIVNFQDETKKYYNDFLKNLFLINNEKIKKRNERIQILTKKTIRNKLLEYFRIESNKSGSRYIYLPSTYLNLADYLAVDRSAMSRELKSLKDEGFIEIEGRKITLLYR